jgi:hypothetical protein
VNPASLNTLFEAVGAALAVHSAWLASRTPAQGVSKAKELWSVLWAANGGPYYLEHHEQWAAGFAAVRCLALLVWCGYAFRRDRSY